MGLFGKRKTTEEILAEGRAQYETGDWKKAFLTLHGLAGKGDPQACYYIGKIYLLERKEKRLAQSFLTTAAKGGEQGAAVLLAEKFGIRDYLPKDGAPQPAPAPAPAGEDLSDLIEQAEADIEALQAEARQRKAENRKPYVVSGAAPAPKTAPKPEPEPAPEPERGGAEEKQRPEQLSREAFDKGLNAYREKNFTEALSLLEKAAELGHASAQFNCGSMYSKGEGTAVDLAKALYWYEKAGAQGDASAQLNCSMMYYLGFGVAVDKAKALYWLEKAAAQGNVDAQFDCGNMCSKGEGTAMDLAKALYWYEKAAEQGHAKAQFNCGVMYDNGEGAAVDKARALYWYEKAAEQGNAKAQFNCGVIYDEGKGTARNRAKAKAYFQKAAAQTGNKAVQEAAKEVLREYF